MARRRFGLPGRLPQGVTGAQYRRPGCQRSVHHRLRYRAADCPAGVTMPLRARQHRTLPQTCLRGLSAMAALHRKAIRAKRRHPSLLSAPRRAAPALANPLSPRTRPPMRAVGPAHEPLGAVHTDIPFGAALHRTRRRDVNDWPVGRWPGRTLRSCERGRFRRPARLRMRFRGGPNLILQHHDDIAFSRYRHFGQEGLEAAR